MKIGKPMKLTEAHHAFAREVERMVGHELAAVRYFGLATEDGEPEPLIQEVGYHSIDFGVDLEMRTGEVFGIVSGCRFTQFDVDITSSSLCEWLTASNIEDQTNHPWWAPLIGQAIVGAKVHWSWVTSYTALAGSLKPVMFGLPRETVWYPQEVELVFQSGFSMFFCAAEFWHGKLRSMAENLSVVFGDSSARLYRIGPYSG